MLECEGTIGVAMEYMPQVWFGFQGRSSYQIDQADSKEGQLAFRSYSRSYKSDLLLSQSI